MARYNYDRLSAQDNSFLIFENPTQHMHVTSTQIFDLGPLETADGGVDFESIKRFTAPLVRDRPAAPAAPSRQAGPRRSAPLSINDTLKVLGQLVGDRRLTNTSRPPRHRAAAARDAQVERVERQVRWSQRRVVTPRRTRYGSGSNARRRP